jgi:DNA mismatch repair protein MutL
MSKVHILPPEIVSKIAAGEVIERPASVLKELLENSLDAQTKSIEVNLKGAGKTLLQIKDTGTGIDKEDLDTIFLRHATSKINQIDDLYHIASLGFRGEALYSISAVSDITLRSKTNE